ncbi:hypothetical protein BDA96_01G067500 [Sorghum bicolor]|uniref:Uncharacterized protein n=2 Tax=Sorghum bicolor TaxID=4558 RepID=A0A1B6QHL3_SORBI|nr:hypothetical protein BDA96_01G067500 [Sorghum bicolor]KXG37406.1 hypothetical protein SORBI_3001G065400 [Sorghum bicolor]
MTCVLLLRLRPQAIVCTSTRLMALCRYPPPELHYCQPLPVCLLRCHRLSCPPPLTLTNFSTLLPQPS